MRKLTLFTSMCLLYVASAMAQNFALIDTDYIYDNIPAVLSADKQLQQAAEEYQSLIETATQKAQSLYQEYEKNVSVWTEEQKTRKEDEIIEAEKEVSQLRIQYFGSEGELEELRAELMQPIEEEIYQAVKTLALRYGYDLVLDRATETGIIFANPSIDISDEVLRELGY